MQTGYEILEHTADVGLRACGPTLETCFEQAGWGLAELLGASRPGAEGEIRLVHAQSSDLGSLLVDYLNELIVMHEMEEVAFVSIRLRLTADELEAEVGVAPLGGEAESTGVKAATYHQLEVREVEGGHEARVYLDV